MIDTCTCQGDRQGANTLARVRQPERFFGAVQETARHFCADERAGKLGMWW